MKKFIAVLAPILVHGFLAAQTLDRVVAVVDNDIILESELNAQVQFFLLNNKMDPKTPNLKSTVLQSMINEKLIVARAIEDSVVVTDEEVQQQLDAVIQQRVQQMGSEAKLEEMYGMPIARIKREYREEMRKNLLAQRLQQQRFGSEQIGRFDVEEFYKTYKDSLPPVPEEVEMSQIFVKPKPSEEAKAATRAKLQSILDSLRAGADFATMAKRYSQDPGSASQGGDLGLVRRGQFVKEFESAVFALGENQISGIIETEFGYHIVQLLERRGDAVHARHILLRIERSKASDEAAIAFLDSLRTRALAGEDFATLAKKYSENTDNNLIGGSLGTKEVDQLDKDFTAAVVNLKPGDISRPSRIPYGSSYGFQIILMRRRTPAHTMTLEQDYRKIEAIALNYRRSRDYQTWMDDLRSKIYWQVRL